MASNEWSDLSKDGDIVIGGLFSFDVINTEDIYAFKSSPVKSKCTRKHFREFKSARTMIFTLEEINRNKKLLPGVTLGYRIFNACGNQNLLSAAMAAVVGPEEQYKSGEDCIATRVQALIGHSTSGTSGIVSKTIAPFHIPLISHLSTCECLSNRNLYPTFFRTVPSDQFQVKALVELLKHFGWTWVGYIYSAETYAEEGTAEFIKTAKEEGICTEYMLQFFGTASENALLSVVQKIKSSTSKVVLAFMSLTYFNNFLEMTKEMNVTGIQWIGSEAWVSARQLANSGTANILQGAMGFAITESYIPGLADFLLSLQPSDAPESIFTRAFWETVFGCSLSSSSSSVNLKLCSGSEDLRTVTNDYTDMSDSRPVYSIYKAVYAVAHAIHSLLQCHNGKNPTTGERCYNKSDIQPWQVLQHLKTVNFTTFSGDKVYFDKNGNSVPEYDLVNWQIDSKGSVKIVNIGRYDGSLPSGKRFIIKQNVSIMWSGNQEKVPKSVCTESCPPGTRKALNKRRPVCCFDCIQCADGEISNGTDSVNCMKCPGEYWSNDRRDQCILKATEFLSYGDIMGLLLLVFACLGALLALAIFAVFYLSKNTPIVRANNSELSFLLLFSLTLCFLCSLTFIGRPSQWSCMLRHTAFGVTFVLCISCVLGKTIVVLMAFRATLPGSNVMKWFGPPQQRLSVLAFTLIQVLICVLWLTLSPPFPNKNMKYYKDKIILECDVGSAVGFWAVLGYIGLLSLMCFVLAFLARKLPDNFNEAKFITFSMLIFCAVWITFIPAYVSSPGKFTVAVEIFAILASSSGLLFCIFLPKCYIIIFRPNLNSKKHLIGKTISK
ncbi:extracellular calcium-sensing receptor-like [Scleropages formosus]|uniref:extracellular calcium-sensing receptor-like n=1 Tax=Scleropages formosus TaxID=113540 RepID=UPI0010FAB0D4|nr:extracellular calcium-sensing receptor-like [Scleropages formosus]